MTYSYMNLFFSQKDLKVLPNAVNNELDHIKNWFNALKFTIFHKMSRENDIPLRPFVLKIDKAVIERKCALSSMEL